MKPIPFEFDPDSHVYSVDGEEVPGCTRVIDTGGWLHYSMVRPDILEAKSILSREVHRCTWLWDEGRLDEASMDPLVAPPVQGWTNFRRDSGFRPLLREHQCIAEAHGFLYGMKLDALGVLDKMETLVEIKMVSTILPHHKLQTAGYALGLPRAIGGIPIKSALARFLGRRRIIVQLKPSGSYQVHECKDIGDADNFLALLRVSYLKRRTEQMYREAA